MLIYLLSETNLARFPIPMPHFSSLVLLAVHCRLAWHTLLHLILNLYIRMSMSCQGCVTSQSMTLKPLLCLFWLAFSAACLWPCSAVLPSWQLTEKPSATVQPAAGPAKAVLLLPGAVCPGFVQRITIFLCLRPESKTVN